MAKPLPKTVASDDCAVTIDDVVYYPHEGETVTIRAGMSVGEVASMDKLRGLGTELLAISGEPDEAPRIIALITPVFEDLCQLLSKRLVSWTWTDDSGEPLPQPDGTAAPLRVLKADELYWLLRAGQNNTPEQRKNA